MPLAQMLRRGNPADSRFLLVSSFSLFDPFPFFLLVWDEVKASPLCIGRDELSGKFPKNCSSFVLFTRASVVLYLELLFPN